MSGPELRLSDAEREAAVNALGEHYAAGRLTKDEYDERSTAAYSAKTASTLRPLFVDLPGPHPFAAAPRTMPRAGAAWPGATWSIPAGATRPPVAPGRRTGNRLPVLPLLLVLVGLAILFNAPWLVFVGFGVLWLARSGRRSWGGGCGSASHQSRGHSKSEGL